MFTIIFIISVFTIIPLMVLYCLVWNLINYLKRKNNMSSRIDIYPTKSGAAFYGNLDIHQVMDLSRRHNTDSFTSSARIKEHGRSELVVVHYKRVIFFNTKGQMVFAS